jgi:hypothetical protein
MWKEMISSHLPEAQFATPASADAVDEIERQLNQPVPQDLKDLLLESNEALGELSLDVIWPAERIIKDNQEFRDLYQPFNAMILFRRQRRG